MLEFIKKLLSKEEKKEEEGVSLEDLGSWIDKKTKPIFGNLSSDIKEAINAINDKREKVFENLEKLGNAKLQNPNIPERAKTVMQGNREAFIKKVTGFFNSIDLQYTDFYGLIEKCKNLEKEMDELGKSTARSYQILSQFFAREVSIIAENIKKIESYSKEIRKLIEHAKIENFDNIKKDLEDAKAKISLKKRLEGEIKEEKGKLDEEKNRLSDSESKIEDAKNSKEHKQYENLLREKEDNERRLREIESKIFHDFSAMEKALKKYSKIAFENGKLVEEYLKEPLRALIKDNNLEIIKILENLSKAVEENKLELDQKKNERALGKIRELDREYFSGLQGSYKKTEEALEKISLDMEDNDAKRQLDNHNKEADNIKNRIEDIKNNIFVNNYELEKIDIDKLKKNLQEEIRNALNEKVIIL
ncbi:hypothetical protein HYU09_01980 [Candidatus Woesearchaeota archaeon]|nr:hypothetical protein [Candidatus Woesearchaeota archaeon]